MQNKNLVFISIFVVLIIFAGAVYFYKGSTTSNVGNIGDTLLKEYSYKKGDNKKNIVVVEFMDPECESCALFHPIMKKLYKEYSDDILIVTKYLANHKNSKMAIEILEASREQNLYDEVLDVIFEKLPIWAKHNNEKPELLWEFLKEVSGLDIEKLKVDIKNPKIAEIIKQDRLDATSLNVRGTPTIFVNGIELENLSQKDLFDLVEKGIYK
ncbi:DsbA family protein [Aliarcobacter cibarius]|jgi:protein-disulfide isomerase|uniref:Disulfide bond formation protein DsbA n=1 Tax=Aliarcobacter cibarius TaxID=255507 RepID=A0A5J6RF97_9BACT|nr:thioredoxin domain-containing protein [Aliarcobacter cibarius]MBP9491290.1 thioredoxin domain-containing protein [Aliarcobacter sp.]QEZ88939.1 protein disulfide oxidoreductase, DsbA/G family [Aliarcobacter cibarius]QKJ26983.1 protein disulfide oxidoreductase, DsbA/G family [Aliarcobacter cibarius]TLS98517.1 disulfide bond formation protein DsbA [Aliarcobacter cibarius]TLS99173.1 disulfide bond formation protein DsbA [Aliarcobacter cibarius]